MRTIIFCYILFFSVLSSCSNGKETKSNEQIEADEFEEYIKNIKINKEHLSNAMVEKGIKLTINGPCDDALMDTIHDRRKAYLDTIKIDNKVTVTFKFIEACCQNFLADYKINGDTMKIELGLVSEGVCSCLCWYRYRFEAPINNQKIKQIEVNIK